MSRIDRVEVHAFAYEVPDWRCRPTVPPASATWSAKGGTVSPPATR